MLKHCYTDLHIHVGKGGDGQWIKIPSSARLTVANIIHEAAVRKGLDIIGIVDCASPSVLGDLEQLLAQGELQELAGGGYRHQSGLTVLTGVELETVETQGCMHTLFFFPTLAEIRQVSLWLGRRATNNRLSSQNVRISLRQVLCELRPFSPLVIPAHIFTPHKSLFGSCAARLAEVVDLDKLTAVELGLSADTAMADRLPDLAELSFLTNSDAHSLEKIGREYSVLAVQDKTFAEVRLALTRGDGRGVTANYGMDPRLGKYHRTACAKCAAVIAAEEAYCPACGGTTFTSGVDERIDAIAPLITAVHPQHRPPYHYQVPLQFVPGLGPKALNKLLARFGTEMSILHRAAEAELATVVGEKIAHIIVTMRRGERRIASGGGGRYGKLL